MEHQVRRQIRSKIACTRRVKRKHRGYGDTFYIDEVFIKINGKQHFLWRAVDQEGLPHERSECFGYGEVVDVYLQAKRDGATAKRFFRRLLRSNGADTVLHTGS